MNKAEFAVFRRSTSDFSKLINTLSPAIAICESCGSEVSSNDVIEIKGYVGCVICLR